MSDINQVQSGGAAYNEAGNVVKTVKTTPIGTSKPKNNPKEVSEVMEEQGIEKGKNGVGKGTVKSVVDTANDLLKTNRTSAKFKYHEATKQVSIKIVDDVTQEVIKEIPPEKSIEMLEKMLEMTGILVDERR